MGFVSTIKDKAGAVMDMLMPLEDNETETEIKDRLKAITDMPMVKTASTVDTAKSGWIKVAGGEAIPVDVPSDEPGMAGPRPKFKVHTNNVPKLKVKIYAPRNFDQVAAIADDLRAGRACVVNYERVENSEQRRICDFVNGTCYVLDGCARRISDQIVLYVPRGVDVSEAMSVVLTD